MKIIIIGAGISGLSTYLLLKKHLQPILPSLSIHVYEAYDIHNLTINVKPLSEANNNEPVFTPAAIGNALGIGNNGLNVLRRLDTDDNILSQIWLRGNPIRYWRMSNARGWTLANVGVVSEAMAEKEVGDGGDEGRVAGQLMIARQDLWEVLRDEALKDGDVVMRKRVADVVIGDALGKSTVTFEDGSSEDADLIIGADGLRSALRRAMFMDSAKQSPSHEQSEKGLFAGLGSWFGKGPTTATDYITPTYEGLGGVGGFIPTKELQKDPNFNPNTMNIVFGPNGFFGYGCISSNASNAANIDTRPDNTGTVSAWWSTFATEDAYPYRIKSPSPSPGSKSEYTFDSATAVQNVLKRHRTWKNDTIQRILDDTASTGLTAHQYYPTWTTPDLPTWQKNGTAVLIGDAAHALPPSSGQGVSQALEDSEALVLLLRHYLSPGKVDIASGDSQAKAIASAVEKYEGLRKPRVQMISDRAKMHQMAKKDVGIVKEMVVYFFIWLFSKVHDKYNEILLDYDLPKEFEKFVAADGLGDEKTKN